MIIIKSVILASAFNPLTLQPLHIKMPMDMSGDTHDCGDKVGSVMTAYLKNFSLQ